MTQRNEESDQNPSDRLDRAFRAVLKVKKEDLDKEQAKIKADREHERKAKKTA